MKLRVVPHAHAHLQVYVEWCKVRGIEPNALMGKADAYIWVEGHRGLVLGVGLFESGGFIMAEYMVADPNSLMLERHRAVLLAAEQLLSLATLRNKVPIVHTVSRGLVRLLGRKGWTLEPYATLLRAPYVQASYRDRPQKNNPADKPVGWAKKETKPKPRRPRAVRPRKRKAS